MENLVVNSSFWKNKRVLITGHTGFKGSWLSLWLQKLGAEVTGYARQAVDNPNMYTVVDIENGMNSVIDDVQNLESLILCIKENKPEIIIHMAAQALVRASYNDPVETYATNVMGTVNILEAVRCSHGVKAVVIVTSDKCYHNHGTEKGYQEDDAMGGYDPYSSSKGCAELVTSAYRNSYFNIKDYGQHGVAVASVRAGNVIGGGDWSEDRLIPDMITGFIKKESVKIRNPKAIRPWQHVLEPLEGYLVLSEKLYTEGSLYAEGWNFGPEKEDARPVSWLADSLVRHWGGDASWEQDAAYHPHEAQCLMLDSSKVRERLEWFPQLPLDIALKWTVEWYKAYTNNKNIREFTEHQISCYQNREIV